jgi:RNA polymerase sigma-70 factor (ECF subfamily)
VQDVAESAFRRHYAQIYRFVRRRSRTDEQAEDITQSVFADAAAAGGRLEPEPPRLLGWLHRVARRRLADEARRSARAPPNVLPLDLARELPARDGLLSAQSASALRKAIARLPRGQREVVVLKLIEGRSFAEIGERLNISPAACKMRFVRALELLRDDLEEEGITP